MQTYEVIFSGEVAPGVDPAQVRAGIQRLFNASDALLDRFFSGNPVVVKRDLDQPSAQKYQRAFNQVGAIVEVRLTAAVPAAVESQAATVPVATTEPEAAGPVAAASPQPAPAAALVPRDEYMAAFTHVQAPDFGVAEVGEDLLEVKPEVAVVEVDVSGMTLAPVGSDLEQLPGAAPVIAPDISHLKLQD